MTDENTKNYRGHTITFNPSSWEFTVAGPEFDDQKYKIVFQSYKAARDEIEKRCDEADKIAAKGYSFSVSVLDANGNLVVANRVNRNTGELSGISTKQFYPNVDWVREALKKRTVLAREMVDIDKALRSIEMSVSIGWGRIEADQYMRKVEGLKKELAEKTVIANEATTPKEATNA